jgi:alkylation response protein AidB-like acyl-CoA dehydrogenase
MEVGSASVVTSLAASRVAAAAHQLHGAIGVTREHSLQLFTRRVAAWRDDGMSAPDWSRLLGMELLEGSGDLWPLITRTTNSEEG